MQKKQVEVPINIVEAKNNTSWMLETQPVSS